MLQRELPTYASRSLHPRRVLRRDQYSFRRKRGAITEKILLDRGSVRYWHTKCGRRYNRSLARDSEVRKRSAGRVADTERDPDEYWKNECHDITCERVHSGLQSHGHVAPRKPGIRAHLHLPCRVCSGHFWGNLGRPLGYLFSFELPPEHRALGERDGAWTVDAVASTLNFGNVPVGSKGLWGTLTATGSAVTISSVTTTNLEFTVGGISAPLNILAGHSIPFTVTFSPQSSGTATATLAFVSNAEKSAAMESVIGSGAVAPHHSVTLSWGASSSTSVVGYKVYRLGTSGGPYAQIASTSRGSLSYIDNTVSAGKSYSYVVTAVTGTGAESAHSNQVEALIPAPYGIVGAQFHDVRRFLMPAWGACPGYPNKKGQWRLKTPLA